MTTDIALIPTKEELDVYQIMAKTAQGSKRFEALGGEAGILSIMLMARELGLPPMQALSGGMNVIQGKVEISPRIMNTMIRKAGHRLEIIELTNTACKIRGVRHDTKEEYVASFTIEDARNAGLLRSGGPWERYPSDMLFARCISRLARRLFADVISTAYVEGEISEDGETPKMPARPMSQSEPKDIPGEVIATAPDYQGFIRELQQTDGTFMGLKLEEYLQSISFSKKTGDAIPISTVMKQALKMPQKFLGSYWAWYHQGEESASEVIEKAGSLL